MIIQPRLGAVLLVTLCARERLLVVFHPDVLVQTRLFRVHLFAVSTRELWRVVTVLGLNVTTQAAVTCELDAAYGTLWLLFLTIWIIRSSCMYKVACYMICVFTREK